MKHLLLKSGAVLLLALLLANAAGASLQLERQPAPGSAFAQAQDGLLVNHAGASFLYQNGASCESCHQEEAHTALLSNHYQWKGKLGVINDFCGYPDINFIGRLTTLTGQVVNGGCAVCHAGMGSKPAASQSVSNVDCLVCHAEGYQRTVQPVNGQLQFVPNPGTITIKEEPGRAECLACHAYAGGGCNNKRGDLEMNLANPPSKDFDVHMASRSKGGAGMLCTDCHRERDHRIAGRGVDLRIDEGVPMRACSECHSNPPHKDSKLDRHVAKVACQACHIPAFARLTSTDMFRDFRAVEVNERNLYEPKITRQANVTPVYAFWNGASQFYNFGDPAAPGQLLAAPLGNINDPAARLFPFKYHQAMQPHDPASGMLLPVKAGILFQTGNVDAAIRQGALEVGNSLPQGYDFVPTARYMGIFHEMAPAEQALECDDCHLSQRIDFAALGYAPNTMRNDRPLCTSCHRPREDWRPAERFYKLHQKHVTDKRLACAECHNFSR